MLTKEELSLVGFQEYAKLIAWADESFITNPVTCLGRSLGAALITDKNEYAPLWIGEAYIPKSERSSYESAGGTHTSPRMHWRRGHIRRQHFGPNNQLVKSVWIEPVVVNAVNKTT